MSTKELFVNDRYPKKSFSSITLLGYKALDLAIAYATEIEGRLPGVGERLGKDLAAMNVVVPGSIQVRNEVVALTSAQNALLQKGFVRAREIRETLRKSGASADVRKAYGVGRDLAPNNFGHVKAALQQIVDRATDEPDEAAGFGLIAADVNALTNLVGALTEADTAQDKKRASAPLSTKERNKTGNRILQTIVLIAGAGRSAFVDEPSVRASFNELMEGLKTAGAQKAKRKRAASKASPSAAASPSVASPSSATSKSPANAASNAAPETSTA